MSKLTHKFCPEIQDKVIEVLLQGNFRTTAAKCAGITEKTLSQWMNSKEKKYHEFQKRVIEAEALVENKAVKEILIAGGKDAKWYAWWLERKFKRWNSSVHRWEIQVLQKQLKDLKNVVHSLSISEPANQVFDEEGGEPEETESGDRPEGHQDICPQQRVQSDR